MSFLTTQCCQTATTTVIHVTSGVDDNGDSKMCLDVFGEFVHICV